MSRPGYSYRYARREAMKAMARAIGEHPQRVRGWELFQSRRGSLDIDSLLTRTLTPGLYRGSRINIPDPWAGKRLNAEQRHPHRTYPERSAKRGPKIPFASVQQTA
jgi:hypothetical protein